MESIYDHGSHDIKMVIVGHKADLQDERAVTMDEGKKVWQSARWSGKEMGQDNIYRSNTHYCTCLQAH